MPLCPGGGSREKETREAPWLLVSRWLRISRGRELVCAGHVEEGALLPEAFWGGSFFSGAPGDHSALGPGNGAIMRLRQ